MSNQRQRKLPLLESRPSWHGLPEQVQQQVLELLGTFYLDIVSAQTEAISEETKEDFHESRH